MESAGGEWVFYIYSVVLEESCLPMCSRRKMWQLERVALDMVCLDLALVTLSQIGLIWVKIDHFKGGDCFQFLFSSLF